MLVYSILQNGIIRLTKQIGKPLFIEIIKVK